MDRKAISPVVAVGLLLIVAVVAVVNFQSWFGSFSSLTYSNTEKKSEQTFDSNIETLIDTTLYIKNSNPENFTINKVKVGTVDCNISEEINSGISEINLSVCLSNVSGGAVQDVSIFTDSGIQAKTFYIKSLAENELDNSTDFPKSCLELYNLGNILNGTYTIDPDGLGVGNPSYEVFCDMTSDGGGWTYLVGNSLYQNGTFPLSPVLDGISFNYSSGSFRGDQGNVVSGSCFIPVPTYDVVVSFNFTQMQYRFTCDWNNNQPVYGYDIGNNGSWESYINLFTIYGGTNAVTLQENRTISANNNTRIYFYCSSCQRNNLPNYLQVHYLKVR